MGVLYFYLKEAEEGDKASPEVGWDGHALVSQDEDS